MEPLKAVCEPAEWQEVGCFNAVQCEMPELRVAFELILLALRTPPAHPEVKLNSLACPCTKQRQEKNQNDAMRARGAEFKGVVGYRRWE